MHQKKFLVLEIKLDFVQNAWKKIAGKKNRRGSKSLILFLKWYVQYTWVEQPMQ